LRDGIKKISGEAQDESWGGYASLRLPVNVSGNLKLFGHEIMFEIFRPMWKTCLSVTDRRTERQTNRRFIVA